MLRNGQQPYRIICYLFIKNIQYYLHSLNKNGAQQGLQVMEKLLSDN